MGTDKFDIIGETNVHFQSISTSYKGHAYEVPGTSGIIQAEDDTQHEMRMAIVYTAYVSSQYLLYCYGMTSSLGQA